MRVDVTNFGKTREGEDAHLYTMRNKRGMELVLSDFGAIIRNLVVLDKDKKPLDVVLGLETIEDYYDNDEGFGSFIGRNANRLGGAKVVISGKTYELEKNDGPNNLHSGSDKSHYKLYQAEVLESDDCASVEFVRRFADGEQGFPGNLDVTVTYCLTEEDELVIDYYAVSDADTVVNLTNHSYFNLNGHSSGTILGHDLVVLADAFTPTGDDLIPTGEIRSVEGTPMDFRKKKAIGLEIDADYAPLKQAGGYDHNYVLAMEKGEQRKAAVLSSDVSGISMEVYTDLPGLQVYSGNFISGKRGKDGAFYKKRDGICFESQFFPNAANEPKFQTSILPAGAEFESTTKYKFVY